MSLKRKYIYGIIRESEPGKLSLSGLGETEVYTINHRGIAAVVSDTGHEEIDPTRKNIRAHAMVQDELVKNCTILPMSFGMIANGKDDILKLLEKNYEGLINELKRLDGKIEIELKAFWDQEAMIKELQSGNAEFARLKAKIKDAPSPFEAQRLLLAAGKLVENIAQDWKATYADVAYSALKKFSMDARLNSPLGIKNILNASYLVEKARESDFQNEVYKLDSHYRGKVNFKYVGPMAPYNFVNMKMEP